MPRLQSGTEPGANASGPHDGSRTPLPATEKEFAGFVGATGATWTSFVVYREIYRRSRHYVATLPSLVFIMGSLPSLGLDLLASEGFEHGVTRLLLVPEQIGWAIVAVIIFDASIIAQRHGFSMAAYAAENKRVVLIVVFWMATALLGGAIVAVRDLGIQDVAGIGRVALLSGALNLLFIAAVGLTLSAYGSDWTGFIRYARRSVLSASDDPHPEWKARAFYAICWGARHLEERFGLPTYRGRWAQLGIPRLRFFAVDVTWASNAADRKRIAEGLEKVAQCDAGHQETLIEVLQGIPPTNLRGSADANRVLEMSTAEFMSEADQDSPSRLGFAGYALLSILGLSAGTAIQLLGLV